MQNGVAVLQIFDYLATGASTFHMGSGAYGQSAMDIGLFQYAGGRYFGGPARTGHEVQDAGAAYIDLQQADSLVEGTISSPRGAQKDHPHGPDRPQQPCGIAAGLLAVVDEQGQPAR
ncbi:hypothetical protein ACFODQ_00190 [Comamonas sp. JC664]